MPREHAVRGYRPTCATLPDKERGLQCSASLLGSACGSCRASAAARFAAGTYPISHDVRHLLDRLRLIQCGDRRRSLAGR